MEEFQRAAGRKYFFSNPVNLQRPMPGARHPLDEVPAGRGHRTVGPDGPLAEPFEGHRWRSRRSTRARTTSVDPIPTTSSLPCEG